MNPVFDLDAMFACEGCVRSEGTKCQSGRLATTFTVFTMQLKWNADASGDGDRSSNALQNEKNVDGTNIFPVAAFIPLHDMQYM